MKKECSMCYNGWHINPYDLLDKCFVCMGKGFIEDDDSIIADVLLPMVESTND